MTTPCLPSARTFVWPNGMFRLVAKTNSHISWFHRHPACLDAQCIQFVAPILCLDLYKSQSVKNHENIDNGYFHENKISSHINVQI